MPSPLRTLDVVLEPDPTRTVIRPFSTGWAKGMEDGRPERLEVIADRVLALPRERAEWLWERVLPPMEDRHRQAREVFMRRYGELPEDVRARCTDEVHRLLLGAVFSQEYAFESAALFNPSILPNPDHDDAEGETGFILSLRGVGEGHVSSVTFRTGVWRKDGSVAVDSPSEQGTSPEITQHLEGDGAQLHWGDSADMSETVLFPVLPSQRQGVEDLRLVLFFDEAGERSAIGTYTAFDGLTARSEILRGIDLRTVEMRPITGTMAGSKGMALFPRKIDGRFVMLGRQDGERIFLLTSDDLYRWEEARPIIAPQYSWEWVQVGNCGSPLEIDEGWLVLTHGVGMVRSYSIGATLLDKDDPSKVLARTPEPLLRPGAEQRGGYVPNVVYGCGMMARGRELLIPYAVGDRYTTFATGTVDEVLAAMEPAAA